MSKGKRKGERRILQESNRFYGEFVNGDGKRERVSLFTDREASTKELERLVKLAERERVGLEAPAERRQTEPIQRHLDEFLIAMKRGDVRGGKKRRAVTDLHVATTKRAIIRVVSACGFDTLESINQASIERFLDKLNEDGLAPRTRNEYQIAVRTFTRWCAKHKRLLQDPLSEMIQQDESQDIRVVRRALSRDGEAQRLLDATERRPIEKPHHFKNIGNDVLDNGDRHRNALRHCLIYKGLLLTGLRRGELDSLAWGDLTYDHETGIYFAPIAAHVDKARKGRVVVFRADLVADLQRWRAMVGNPGDDEPMLRVRDAIVVRLKSDLKHAGIAFQTRAGRVDIHALRVTCGTWLEHVSSVRVAGQHLGHCGNTLTEAKYVKHDLQTIADALDKLPALTIHGLHDPNALRATGTEDRAADGVKPAVKAPGFCGRLSASIGETGDSSETEPNGLDRVTSYVVNGYNGGLSGEENSSANHVRRPACFLPGPRRTRIVPPQAVPEEWAPFAESPDGTL